MALVWINNRFEEEESAVVSIRDTGLLHGVGVFTTMRAEGGKVVRLAQHLQRVRDSCNALYIPLTWSDEVLTSAVNELLARNSLQRARLRLTVTRGPTTQHPLHGMRIEPNAFLTATDFEPYPAEHYSRGMTVVVLDEQKLNPYDVQAGHKTLNYFSRLQALRSAAMRRAGEALWFNVHNYLESGSISNVFLVRNNVLLTPPTRQDLQDPDIAKSVPYPCSAVLPGVTRKAVIDLARADGIEVRIGALTINDLLDAHEVFLTNSIMGIMPVCRVERSAIGDDQPGPITQKLSRLLESTED